MTNTESLYTRIAEQEGYVFEQAAAGDECYFIKGGTVYSRKSFCFRLIEKYKLDVKWCDHMEVWRIVGERVAWSRRKSFEDKNLENAVMLATLSISEGE